MTTAKCDRTGCNSKATVLYWVQNPCARHVRFCCDVHCQWARQLLKERQPESVVHRHNLKDGTLKFPPLPAGQQTREREHMLELIISVPHYGKPDHDMPTAVGILRSLQVSLHANVTMEMIDDDGNCVPVEYVDPHDSIDWEGRPLDAA